MNKCQIVIFFSEEALMDEGISGLAPVAAVSFFEARKKDVAEDGTKGNLKYKIAAPNI